MKKVFSIIYTYEENGIPDTYVSSFIFVNKEDAEKYAVSRVKSLGLLDYKIVYQFLFDHDI